MTIPEMEQHITRLEKKCREQRNEIRELRQQLMSTPSVESGAKTLPPERMAPMKVSSIETHDSPEGLIFVYVIERDRMQDYALNLKWHADHGLTTESHNCQDVHPENIPEWVAMDGLRMATRTPLNVGVGEHYTLDLIPFQKLPVPVTEQPTLSDFLRRLMGE